MDAELFKKLNYRPVTLDGFRIKAGDHGAAVLHERAEAKKERSVAPVTFNGELANFGTNLVDDSLI